MPYALKAHAHMAATHQYQTVYGRVPTKAVTRDMPRAIPSAPKAKDVLCARESISR